MSEGVRKIFAEVPRTYELVNHLLTVQFKRLLFGVAAVHVAVKEPLGSAGEE